MLIYNIKNIYIMGKNATYLLPDNGCKPIFVFYLEIKRQESLLAESALPVDLSVQNQVFQNAVFYC